MELIGILINLRINQKKEVKANETTTNHNRSLGAGGVSSLIHPV